MVAFSAFYIRKGLLQFRKYRSVGYGNLKEFMLQGTLYQRYLSDYICPHYLCPKEFMQINIMDTMK